MCMGGMCAKCSEELNKHKEMEEKVRALILQLDSNMNNQEFEEVKNEILCLLDGIE